MTIKRYIADADNTITNSFKANLSTRATGSNMGLSDSVEVFSIFGQASGSTAGYSQELSRILMQFPISDISTDRTNGIIPESGSVSFFLRMYNAKHPFTTPTNFNLVVHPVRELWEEGYGLDMDEYKDLTYDGSGSNWLRRATSSAGVLSWLKPGGTHYGHENPPTTYTVNFAKGTEDMEVDISELVEQWIKGSGGGGKANYGVLVKLTGSQEGYSAVTGDSEIVTNTTGSKTSFYTKKFFARDSEYFFKRPCIEARFDESTKDDRGNFYYSSSLATADANTNTLYLYNYVRGKLTNIPGVATDYSGEVYVSFFSGNVDNTAISTTHGPIQLVNTTDFVQSGNPHCVTGGYVSTGIYSASIVLTGAATPLTRIYDVWFTGSLDTRSSEKNDAVRFHTGSFDPNTLDSSPIYKTPTYSSKITNLKTNYGPNENTRFRLFVREVGEDYNIYTKATNEIENLIVEDAYYRIYRVTDDLEIINFGTGSLTPGAEEAKTDYTRLSFDVSGNYFDFDTSLLESGYSYGIKFAYYDGEGYLEQPDVFKFRIVDKT